MCDTPMLGLPRAGLLTSSHGNFFNCAIHGALLRKLLRERIIQRRVLEEEVSKRTANAIAYTCQYAGADVAQRAKEREETSARFVNDPLQFWIRLTNFRTAIRCISGQTRRQWQQYQRRGARSMSIAKNDDNTLMFVDPTLPMNHSARVVFCTIPRSVPYIHLHFPYLAYRLISTLICLYHQRCRPRNHLQ